MRLFLEFRSRKPSDHAGRVDTDAASQATNDIRATVDRALFDSGRDWLTVDGRDRERLIGEMVEQLPRSDAEKFLQTVSHGYRSKQLSAGLTVSSFTDVGPGGVAYVLRIRAFVDEHQEVKLPGLGRELANLLLTAFPKMRMVDMIIWMDRGRRVILAGHEQEMKTRRQVLRDTPAPAALFTIFGLVLVMLLIGVGVEWATPVRIHLLGDDASEWFKRSFAPLLSAIIASAATLQFEYAQTRRRRADWNIAGT